MHIDDKIINPRKPHQCRVCGDMIDVGEECHAYTGVTTDGFYTIYFHHLCWNYSSDWDGWESETVSPGVVSRKEILEEIPNENTNNPKETQ